MTFRRICSMVLAASAVCVAHYIIALAFVLAFWTRFDPQPWEAYQYVLVVIEFFVDMAFEIVAGIIPVIVIIALTRAREHPWRAVPVLVVGAVLGTVPLLAAPVQVNGWFAIALVILGLWLAGVAYHCFGGVGRRGGTIDPTTAE